MEDYLDLLWFQARTYIVVGSNCQNTTQQRLSNVYQTNLEKILTWASSDAAISKGYNSKSISNSSPLYAHYDCRGDVVGYFCQFCVSNAAREVPQRCPNRVSAMVWYDFCILRYSNENFFGTILTNPSWHALGEKNISNMKDILKGVDFLRSLIRKATVETHKLWYMDGFNLSSTQKRYGFVQCSRDLTNDGCIECLEAMLAEVPKFCEQKLGCFIWSGTYGLSLSSFHKIQTEETLNTDLPIIPLITILQSTDNFSEAYKLGEGGFGSVYKGILPDGRQVAVKRLSKFSGQGSEEFNNEVMFIAKLQHRNLAWRIWCEGKCLELMDPILEKSFKASEVEKCIHIALLCVQENATDRPTMSDVVVMLGSDKMDLPKAKHPAFSIGKKASKEVTTSKRFKNLFNNDVTISITLPSSMCVPISALGTTSSYIYACE
ncbi:unnamed protein product [Sphenostylis stenocarpa]|uniref:Cysteine-rich receptor-like protein kinase 25 n=1 Tax=Sphenostylis stenocarpa TaxID=92480 RepID=A0AA87B7M5_9FABA|nr:unnamed protein product [Sphenostylis stenocarpa]